MRPVPRRRRAGPNGAEDAGNELLERCKPDHKGEAWFVVKDPLSSFIVMSDGNTPEAALRAAGLMEPDTDTRRIPAERSGR